MVDLIALIPLFYFLTPGDACFGRLGPAPRYLPGEVLLDPALGGQPLGVPLAQPISTGSYGLPSYGQSISQLPSQAAVAYNPSPKASKKKPKAPQTVPSDPLPAGSAAETPWHDFINSLTGGTVTPYDGQALSLVQQSDDLSCSFGGGERCCWHNVRNSADELDWSLTSQPISISQLSGFNAQNVPDMPALITGAPKTQRWVQAILTSCPIPCQQGDGQLTISHWLSPGVLLDVCRLKVGAREYLDCQQPLKSSGRSTVTIPGLDEPFYVVLVASEFVGESWQYEGGVAIIDDVQYRGANICVPSSDVTNQK